MPSQDWWLQSGTTSTAQVAAGFVTAADLAPNAVAASEIAAGAVGSDELADSAVTAAKIGTGAVTADKIGTAAVTEGKIAGLAVTSGKISANAIVRFVTLPLLSTRTVSSSAGYDSGNVIWYPTHALTIQSINVLTGREWVNTTCEVAATIYRNSSSSVADLTLTSTTYAAGSRVAVGLTANLDIAANTTVTMKWTHSTCTELGTATGLAAGTIQIAYVTTG